MIYCPLPDSLRIGYFFYVVCQIFMLLSKSIFYHFWRRKRNSLVKPIDTSLISSAIPFFLSSLFLRSPFHIENSECTILCMVSRFLAAFADLRFILSCSRLQSSVQCMLSIDQCLRTNETNAGVSVGRLLTYSLFSAVCVPDDFFTVSESYSITVMFPHHFPLSAMMSRPSKTR